MKRIFIPLTALLLTTSVMESCDVRKKDQAAEGLTNTDVLKQDAIASPTTVEIIDSVFNFGTITEGENVEFNYRFKNTGTNPLVISNVSASCGCTIPEKPEHPILQGEIGYIKVKFNSDNRPGEAHKSVTVISNANPAFPALMLTGTVNKKGE